MGKAKARNVMNKRVLILLLDRLSPMMQMKRWKMLKQRKSVEYLPW